MEVSTIEEIYQDSLELRGLLQTLWVISHMDIDESEEDIGEKGVIDSGAISNLALERVEELCKHLSQLSLDNIRGRIDKR